jgi:hypothetical protein
MNCIGWQTNGSIAFGFASEIPVSSTAIQLPAVGIGVLSDAVLRDGGVSASNIRINLESPLSSTLTIDLKNLTTSNDLGAFTISAGNLTAFGSASLVASQNDVLVISLSVSGSSEILQGISWFIF